MKFWASVEAKVKAAALGTLAASVIVALLNAVVGSSKLLGSLPPTLQFLLVTVAPTVIAFLSGYSARHTAVAPVQPATPVASVKPAA